MKVLLTAAGSRGDMQPILALALALRARGHEPRVCASPNGAAMFERHQLPFFPMGLDTREFLVENAAAAQDAPIAALRGFLGVVKRLVDSQMALLPAHAAWADVFLGSGLVVAGPTAAELAGIPYRLAILCPQLIPSASHPPFLYPGEGNPWLNRALWWAVKRVLHYGGARGMDAHRRALGLPALPDYYTQIFTPGSLLVATEPTLSPAPTDYDASVNQTGFWLVPEAPAEALAPELLDYVRAAPTVFVGFGSMPDPDPATTTALIAEGVRRAGVRALIHRGWAGLGGGDLPDNCRVIGPTPHSALFRELAGVIHHGGSGTTATAARAGVPQVAVPHLLDQPYWGRQIHGAGLGPPAIRRGRLTPDKLAALIRSLAAGEHREAAAAMADTLSARGGVEAAVDALENAR